MKWFMHLFVIVSGTLLVLTGIIWYQRMPTTKISPTVALPTAPAIQSPPVATQPLLQELLDKRWLLFFQNPYELRSTGGFWGTIGSIQSKSDGTFDYWVKDVYAIDGPAQWSKKKLSLPPEPIQRFININSWYLRDANWDADFAMSARRALEFYDLETGTTNTFDGVLAINPEILKDILSITGTITVDGVQFTKESVVETIVDAVEIDYRKKGIPQSERKAILHHLVTAIVHDTRTPTILLGLIKHLPQYQERKSIQLYARDRDVERRIVESGWSGVLKESTDDYLMIADNNYAALKTDRVMTRSTDYSVIRTPQKTNAALSLTYTNHAKVFDYRTTRYRTFTRVYVPLGAVLEKHQGVLVNDSLKEPNGREGPVTVEHIQGKTVFGFFTSVEPGQTKTVELLYSFPTPTITAIDSYTLLVQHQSGVNERPLTASIRFGTTTKPIMVKRSGSTDELINVMR